MSKSVMFGRLGFAVTGAASFGTSWVIFRDLTDFSQWIVERTSRDDVFRTFQMRSPLTALSLTATALNTGIVFRTRCVPKPLWAVVSGASLFMTYMGYVNPEIMMRARNRNAMFLGIDQAQHLIEGKETVIVTQVAPDQPARAFPDTQIVRPHVVRVGRTSNNIPATIAYCGLTGTGIVYETPPNPDGSEVDWVPITQLENNLILLDKNSGDMGHQINGVNETCLLSEMSKENSRKTFEDTARRPSTQQLSELGVKAYTEVASWRMSMHNFARTYPKGEVFINDYKEFPNVKRPVLTLYDKLIDTIFAGAIHQHNVQSEPIFPTITDIDDRLPNKKRVWGFNVDDDFVALTEDFVRDAPNGVRNMTIGGAPLVAAWDSKAASLGVWKRPSDKTITQNVDVFGRVKGQSEPLPRLNTVKNGIFWFVWQNFFPDTKLNPTN